MGSNATRVVLYVLCIGALLQLAVAAGSNNNNTEAYSCDAISKVPAQDRCSFVRSKCPSESLVPYAEWYHCHVAQANVAARCLYVAAVCCLLPLAFCLLGDTAEFYIAPIMAHVSQAIPKMRPRFAGVTFVALGNGAPDLSSNIAAISTGEVVLSAGALTGAAMFVQCIVAAELVSLAGSGGIKCGGAMLRDVGVYCLAILSVLLAFAIGQVSQVFVGWAVALYIVYMVWVFAGDEWHQRGRPKPRLDVKSFKSMISSYLPGSTGIDYHHRQPGATGGSGSWQGGGVSAGTTPGFGSKEDLEESLLPWAVAEEEEDRFYPPSSFEQSHQQGVGPGGGGVGSLRTSSGLRSSMLGGLRQSSDASSAAAYASTELSDFGTVQFSHRSSSTPESVFRGTTGASSVPGIPASAQLSSVAYALQSDQQYSNLPGQQQQQLQQQQQQQQQQHPHVVSLGNQSYIDAKTYRQLVWADLADDEEEEARLEQVIAQQLMAGRRARSGSHPGHGTYQPPSAVERSAASFPALSSQQQQQQQQQYRSSLRPASSMPVPQPTGSHAAVPPSGEMESGLLLSPFGPGAVRTAPSTPLSSDGAAAARAGFSPVAAAAADYAAATSSDHPPGAGLLAAAEKVAGSGDAWQQLQWQVTLGNSEEWAEAGPVRVAFRKVAFPLLLPAYLGQRLTIPFASSAGYSREWLIASLLCCPLALILYLGLLTLPAIFIACGCGIVAAAAAAVLTWWDAPGQMPVQGLGGVAAAVVPGVLAVLAFCMGVVWIDTIATEVVGVITFLGGLASLPAGVMGLTLLAWGNSLGDFFGNRAMAKAGHASTAITACFAAPLFNMLMSLSLGFSSYLHHLGTSSVKVQLTPEVALGCLFLMGYNMAIICVGRLCGQRLPPWFAYFARAWYGLYFVLSVLSGFWSNSS